MSALTRACLLAVLLPSAAGAASAPRALPSLVLTDRTGASVTETSLAQASNWVLVVVDADKHLTLSVLPRLQRKDADWAGRLVVVATGSPAAFDRMVAQNAKLSGALWYRDGSGQLLQQLGLSGTPVLLGIGPDNVISWQIATIPEAPDKAQAVVAGWTFPPAGER